MRKKYQRPNAESAAYVTNVIIAASDDPTRSSEHRNAHETGYTSGGTWGNIWGNR